MRISDWSSDVCSSDLSIRQAQADTRRLVAVDALDDQLNIAETQAITDHRVRQMCSQQLRNGLVVIRLRQRQAIALAQGGDRGVAIDGEVAAVTSRQRLRRQLRRFEATVEWLELPLRGAHRDIVSRLQQSEERA